MPAESFIQVVEQDVRGSDIDEDGVRRSASATLRSSVCSGRPVDRIPSSIHPYVVETVIVAPGAPPLVFNAINRLENCPRAEPEEFVLGDAVATDRLN